ncbi:MAG: DoxX family protein [Candidatus Sulfotelmatobacter sp.]|jgi:hypothetical protein
MNSNVSVAAAGVVDEPAGSSPSSKKMVWSGRIVSGLAISLFLFTAMFGLLKPAMAAQGFAHYNYPDRALLPILIVELACVALYAIPRTSVLGAILLTGYLGGATATHVRVSEPFFLPILVGIAIWLGLFLREPRLRTIIPLRSRN